MAEATWIRFLNRFPVGANRINDDTWRFVPLPAAIDHGTGANCADNGVGVGDDTRCIFYEKFGRITEFEAT